MSENFNHIENALGRLATQYTEAETFKSYISALLAEDQNLEFETCEVIDKRNIDDAEGDVLDAIGELVGQDRVLVDSTTLGWFGFQTATGAQGFDDGVFFGETLDINGNRELTDDEYRAFIRARIAKNSGNGTIEDLIESIKLITQKDTAFVTEGIMTISIALQGLTDNQKALVKNTDLIPKPAGVRIEEFLTFEEGYFAVAGFSGASGFDEGIIADSF